MSDTPTPAELTGQREQWYLGVDTLAGLSKVVASLDSEALARAVQAAGLNPADANELRYRAQELAKDPIYRAPRSSLERDLHDAEAYVLTGNRIAQVHVNDPKNPGRGIVININDEGQAGPWVQVFPKAITPDGRDLVGDDDDLRIDGSDWTYDDEVSEDVLAEIRDRYAAAEEGGEEADEDEE